MYCTVGWRGGDVHNVTSTRGEIVTFTGSINSAFLALPSLHTPRRPPLRTIDTLKRCDFHEQATVGTSRHRCCSPSHIASLTIKKVFLGWDDRRAKLMILNRYVCVHREKQREPCDKAATRVAAVMAVATAVAAGAAEATA
ncbi:hypothetical protein O3P69_008082 [Scylla paramamosain]|uniref:Uncharacterized protein n=1 Tax=Scylla paramamosain TaxID=85552 RepID=A0AAW0T208_SCYPA